MSWMTPGASGGVTASTHVPAQHRRRRRSRKISSHPVPARARSRTRPTPRLGDDVAHEVVRRVVDQLDLAAADRPARAVTPAPVEPRPRRRPGDRSPRRVSRWVTAVTSAVDGGAQQPAAVDDDDVVADPLELAQQVRGDQHRDAELVPIRRIRASMSSRPAGSRPLVGSSSSTSCGSCTSAWASLTRCFMPVE